MKTIGVRYAGAAHQGESPNGTSALFRALRVNADLGIALLTLENHVHDPADRVRAVDGRRAVTQDFNPIHGRHRQGIEIDRGAIERMVDQSPAVQ